MGELERLQKKIVELEAVLGLVKKDLLLRAEHVSPRPHVLQNSYGAKVVGLSSSVWCLLKALEPDNE
tara:strand:+ start:626 stop:826 length:201 start_codon:yes stop_codon:yes gene_type:complete